MTIYYINERWKNMKFFILKNLVFLVFLNFSRHFQINVFYMIELNGVIFYGDDGVLCIIHHIMLTYTHAHQTFQRFRYSWKIMVKIFSISWSTRVSTYLCYKSCFFFICVNSIHRTM